MQILIRRLLPFVLLELFATGGALHAQDTAVRADTVRGAEFSDRTFSRAFGLAPATSGHVDAARSALRCMDVDDAILCNMTAPDGSSWDDCATLGLVSQFIVWFDLLEGAATDKRVYAAVVCPGQTVTMSSLRRHPVVEFTLASRNNDSSVETSRTIVFITTPER